MSISCNYMCVGCNNVRTVSLLIGMCSKSEEEGDRRYVQK